MNLKLVYWNSLHPKQASLPSFSGQTPHFKGKKAENQKRQPTPLESWVRCCPFEPKGGSPTYTTSGAIIVSTLWQ